MTVGEKIKLRREELGLTQEELALRVGYKSRSSINKIELSRDLPLKKAKSLAAALDLSVGYLMDWEESKPTSFELYQNYTNEVKNNMLDKDEAELLELYRSFPKEDRRKVIELIGFFKNQSRPN